MKYEIPTLPYPLEFVFAIDSQDDTEVSKIDITELEQFTILKYLKFCSLELDALYQKQGLCEEAFLYANGCVQVLTNPDFTKQDENFKDEAFSYIFAAMDFLKEYLDLQENIIDLSQIKELAAKIQSSI